MAAITDSAAQHDADDGSDAHLAERCIATTQAWRGGFLDVRCDTVSLPDGSRATREYIVHPGAVMIVPLLDDGRLLLERQYRYPMRRVMLEFPAGKVEPGEPTLATAARELAEETGHRAREWACAGVLHNAIAYSDEFIEIWFARGLQPGTARPDAGEFIELARHTEAELDALAAAGALTDAKTLIGLLWLQNWRLGRWPLRWQPAPPGPAG